MTRLAIWMGVLASPARGMVAACLLLATGWAASGADQEGLVQAEAGQVQLQASTARVAAQLDTILEEFRRNGLSGEEVELLGTIRGVLGQLSDDDMARVIGLIQGARGSPEGLARRGSLLEAFGTQKSVGVKLRQILLEYERQQELAGLAARLEELAHRQQVAMRETLALAVSIAGRRREWLSENQRIALQLQLSEQQSLHDEVVSVLQRLKGWTGERDNEAAARAQAALTGREPARLEWVLETLVRDLGAGQVYSAAGLQREARGLMREIARQLLPPQDEMDALLTAVRMIEGLVGRQQEAQVATRQLVDRSASHERTLTEQGELVDETDVVRHFVGMLDTPAAEQVAASIGRMQEARGLIDVPAREVRTRRLGASTQQELALARLESARRLLQQRIDTLEKQRQAMSDPLSNLRQIREDVADLMRREQELQGDAKAVEKDPAQLRPMAPRQGDLGDRSDDAASRAALDAPEAAEQIAEAAAQMRRSQRSLGEGQNNPGAQQASVDALAKALATLDAQLEALAAAEKELALLEELLARLLALIDSQRDLNAETAKLARNVPGRATTVVGREQDGLAGQARAIEKDVPASVPQAATYVGDAATQMILAGNELGSGRAAEARPTQEEALENLLRARRELEQRMAELREMLGQPPDAASMEELAKMIREAQQQVNEGLNSEAMNNMARSLQKAGQEIRPATSGRMGRMPRMIRDPLERADRALREGAAAAEGGDRPGADQEAAQAQEALAAASAALDLAMAGMGQQPGEGEGSGGEGQSEGQGEAQGRGRQPGAQPGRGTGDAGNFFGKGGADGPGRSTIGTGRFIGLPARDRAALLQSQGDSYPQEYAPMIEQYMKNLSDQGDGGGGGGER